MLYSGAANGATTDAISADTWYHIWLRHDTSGAVTSSVGFSPIPQNLHLEINSKYYGGTGTNPDNVRIQRDLIHKQLL